jgi:hypothetical protein
VNTFVTVGAGSAQGNHMTSAPGELGERPQPGAEFLAALQTLQPEGASCTRGRPDGGLRVGVSYSGTVTARSLVSGPDPAHPVSDDLARLPDAT